MEKLNGFAASPGNDFYGAFQAADPNNSAIDSEIASYLNNNPDGIEFSYGGKDYVLAKDKTTNKYTLHLQTPSGSVLKDEDVQMNTKYAPDGFVEIGGLSKAGTRLFIGRAPDNVEQVIAFEGAHDIRDVLFRPDNAVVLYDGSKNPTADAPAADAPADTEAPNTPSGAQDQDDFADFFNGWMDGGATVPPESEPEPVGGGAIVPPESEPEPVGGGATVPPESEPEPVGGGAIVPTDSGEPVSEDVGSATDSIDEAAPVQADSMDYVYPRSLNDGQYEVTGDGFWISSSGERIGQSMVEAGIYEVKNGKLLRPLNAGTGDSVMIPADDYSGGYILGSTFKTLDGKTQEASFEFLLQSGVDVYDIAMKYIDISNDTSGQFSKIKMDGLTLIADADGKVLGMAYA